MGILSLIILAIGVSMDTFAVSICNGMTSSKCNKIAIISAIWFSTFQVIMLSLGFLLFSLFDEYIDIFDHWIAFILLTINGIKTIKESNEQKDIKNDLSLKNMFSLSFATSIDALAVGISFALLGVDLKIGVLTIFTCTFFLTILGTIIGHKFGKKYKKKASIFGGIILILIGVKILIEGLCR